jgi:hypothetical protein
MSIHRVPGEWSGRCGQVSGTFVIFVVLVGIRGVVISECGGRWVVMRVVAWRLVGRVRVISGHRWIVTTGIALIIVVVFGIGAGGNTSVHRGGVILVVDGEIGESWLRKRLGNKFALLVLEMGIITNSFLLGLSSSLQAALLLFSLDDITDALGTENTLSG